MFGSTSGAKTAKPGPRTNDFPHNNRQRELCKKLPNLQDGRLSLCHFEPILAGESCPIMCVESLWFQPLSLSNLGTWRPYGCCLPRPAEQPTDATIRYHRGQQGERNGVTVLAGDARPSPATRIDYHSRATDLDHAISGLPNRLSANRRIHPLVESERHDQQHESGEATVMKAALAQRPPHISCRSKNFPPEYRSECKCSTAYKKVVRFRTYGDSGQPELAPGKLAQWLIESVHSNESGTPSPGRVRTYLDGIGSQTSHGGLPPQPSQRPQAG